MSLQNKNAVVYGAGGAVGAAVARAFARDGARVFLTGRDKGALDALAKEITSAGGAAETARVDAMDPAAVESHLDSVVARAGTIDISFNAIGIPQQGMQGIPLTELSVESFTLPIATYPRAHFVTARTAARHMIKQQSGVILMHTPEPARLGVPMTGGMSPAWRHSKASIGCSQRNGGHTASAPCACEPPASRKQQRSMSSSVCTPTRTESPRSNSRQLS